MTKEKKNTSNKESGTITAAIGGVVVGAAATKLLSNNNNVRKYTKEEANFRNINGGKGGAAKEVTVGREDIFGPITCKCCVHSKSGINGGTCAIVKTDIDVEDLGYHICKFHVEDLDALRER